MSLLAFRDAAETFVRTSVMGSQAVAPKGKLSAYGAEIFSSLRAGEKGFALRVWQTEEDAEHDANAIYPVAGVEVTIAKKLIVEEDEVLYTEDEMLQNQAALLVARDWRALVSANSLIEPVTIEAVPEREEHVISYVVTLTMRLDPI